MALSVSFRRVLALAIAVLTVSLVVDATQVMHRPDNYQDAPRQVQTGNVTPQIVHKRSPGMVQAAYFTNWCVSHESYHASLIETQVGGGAFRGIYGANFRERDETMSFLSVHVLR